LAERPTYVIDASVVGRWFLKSPPFLELADQLQSDFDGGNFTLIAPENLFHEVTGAIHQAIFARRITARIGRSLIDRLLALEVTTIETNELIQPSFDLSLRYGCSYYDAIYLEIARRLDCPFIHADGNLRRAMNGRFPLELWIEDFPR
jgi:predicted nucleic acid-binding protein